MSVNRELKKRIAELETELSAAKKVCRELVAVLRVKDARIAELATGWKHYALCHVRYGGDDLKTGRAWNNMDRICKALEEE